MSATLTPLPPPVPLPPPSPVDRPVDAAASTAGSTPEPRSPRPVGRAVRRLAQLALVAAAIGLSFLIDSGIFAAVVVLFLVIVPFEKFYPRQKGQKVRRPLVATDIGWALTGPVLNVFGIAAIVVIGGLSFAWLPGLALRPLVGLIPAAVAPVAGFLMFDFASYWTHRFAHEVPFMWRFHSVHHSPEHMDWVSGFRVHPFDGVLIAPGFFFLIGAGVDAEVAGVFAVLQIVLGIFFHANVRVRWRWLDRIACNPEFHHWHHANEPDSIGHNYSAALPVWDLMFGTFFMPKHTIGRRPRRYGLDEPLPRNLVGQITHPCRGVRRHLWLWRRPVKAARTAGVAARNLLADIRRSATRPTHSIRRTSGPGTSTTNASLVGPNAAPKPVKRPLPEPVSSPGGRRSRAAART